MRNEGGRNRLSVQNIQHHQSVAIICSLSLGHVLHHLNSFLQNDCAAFEAEIMQERPAIWGWEYELFSQWKAICGIRSERKTNDIYSTL